MVLTLILILSFPEKRDDYLTDIAILPCYVYIAHAVLNPASRLRVCRSVVRDRGVRLHLGGNLSKSPSRTWPMFAIVGCSSVGDVGGAFSPELATPALAASSAFCFSRFSRLARATIAFLVERFVRRRQFGRRRRIHRRIELILLCFRHCITFSLGAGKG